MAASESNHIDEHSAAATTIQFDRPVPLLRGPVRASPTDDPSSGPYVLAFRDPKAWANAYRACKSKMVEQCVAGARIGCAISGSEKCKPPWWRALIAKEKCGGFAKEKCLKSFREARIAGVNVKQAERLVCWGTVADRSTWVNLIGLEKLGISGSTTNYRAGELFGSDSEVDGILGGEILENGGESWCICDEILDEIVADEVGLCKRYVRLNSASLI
ncbi:hypothetical protein C1H46_024162 [Malus baccata]|uniref:Uncharacterized protein n=1 Tax=Malus baccata TaxID=106549 RepID=A0A540LUR3_MALBA|nr:hypothetical protein C1H46_024162 [Malus baccata]